MAVRADTVEEFFGDPVYSYSRAQAIEDGTLVDVTELAREYGFRFPVAFTRAVWDGYVTPPEKLKGWQDETGRAWDVLTMLRLACRQGGRQVLFGVLFQMKPGRRAQLVRLKAVSGPGDDGAPVLTVMLPEED